LRRAIPLSSRINTNRRVALKKARIVLITNEIFQVGGGALSSPDDAAVYLVSLGDRPTLVDSGCGRSTARITENIRECGADPRQIERLLLTHCHFDHSGGANSLRDALQCRVVAHERDALFLEEGNASVTAAAWYGETMAPLPVDLKLSGSGGAIPLGERSIEWLHIPGHSPGSVAYLVESEGLKVLFGQDVHGPIHPALLSDREAYQRSLGLLLSLEADILCEGHFGIVRGKDAVAGFIEEYLD
jgi:glyoxylase-like metal-dependent hydrolase (beta-lactamase superfamily II)